MVLYSFGKRIKNLRNEKGISQEKFAMIANIDRTYLAGIENGKRNITLKVIEKLADAFNMTIEELFSGVKKD